MRIDDYLSTVGIIKRRTIAKQLGSNGLIEANGRKVKPSYDVKVGDLIVIKGSNPLRVEVLLMPGGSVAKEERDRFYKILLT